MEKEDDPLALSLSPPSRRSNPSTPLQSISQASLSTRLPLPPPTHIHLPLFTASAMSHSEGERTEQQHRLSFSAGVPTIHSTHHQAQPNQPRHLPHQPPPHRPAVQQPPPHRDSVVQQPAQQRAFRGRRNPTQAPRAGKGDTIEPPFPWSTNRRATVYSLEELLLRGIDKIQGEVQCKKCEGREVIVYNLREKFAETARFIAARKHAMHDRAPSEWMSPEFPRCRVCAESNCMKPVVSEKKRSINWLFMLLGQTLGCCTLEQLKYFCKHTKNHRTGAKDRVLYLTYLGLCKQLDPSGPFDR